MSFICDNRWLHLLEGSVVARTHTHYLREKAREIIWVVNAELIANLVKFHRRVIEQIARLLYFQQIIVGKRTMPRLLLELHRKVRLRVADIGGNLGKREVSLHVFLHKVNRSLHGIRAIGTLSHLAILLNVAQRAKIVVEERHGIAQVLNAVSGIQGVKQLLKEVYSIADARVQAGVYRLRHNGILSVIFCKFALEVNPIDSPWLRLVGLISVWQPGRENKILLLSAKLF